MKISEENAAGLLGQDCKIKLFMIVIVLLFITVKSSAIIIVFSDGRTERYPQEIIAFIHWEKQEAQRGDYFKMLWTICENLRLLSYFTNGKKREIMGTYFYILK